MSSDLDILIKSGNPQRIRCRYVLWSDVNDSSSDELSVSEFKRFHITAATVGAERTGIVPLSVTLEAS